MPTGKQIRAARVLAGWDIKDLAPRAGLSVTAVQNIETGAIPKPATTQRIVKAFSDVGVEFTDNEGVRRRPQGVEIFEGAARFEDFMSFMYEYLENEGGDVCIYIQDETLLRRTRKNIEAHRNRMAKLAQSGQIKGRILAAKGVEKSDWAEIRRIPIRLDTPQVSFHTFGDNLALISFEHEDPPYVVLHKSGPFASVYKNAFDAAWKEAKAVV